MPDIASPIAVLEFGSPALLGWLAAAALPWVVNLWSRNRYDETHWAAIELLLEAIQNESRRIKLQNWLLLALRTGIVALVALAVAQPEWRPATGAAPQRDSVHRVLVFDASLSMGARAGDATRLEHAQAIAAQLVDVAAPGDAFSVLAWGAGVEELLGRPVQDPSQVRAAVNAIEQQATRSELDAIFSAVEQSLARGRELFPHIAAAEVAWLTDRAETTWGELLGDDSVATARQSAWKRLAATATMRFPLEADGLRDNRAVVDAALDPPSVTAGARGAIVAVVRSFGDATGPVQVELLADGVAMERQTVELARDAAVSVRFELPPLAAGDAAWEVRLDGADALAADDRRWVAASVPLVRRIACIEESPRGADDFARALAPRGAMATAGMSVMQFPAAELGGLPLSDYAATILCNVAEVSEREATVLRRCVATGGALGVVLGDRVDADNFNDRFGPVQDDAASIPLAPLRIAGAPIGGPRRIDPLDYRHPVVAPFAGRERAGLLTARVLKHVPLEPWPEASEAVVGPVEIAATLDDGDPLVVLRDFGAGRVGMIATDFALRRPGGDATSAEPWSTLAASPAFVPLVQRFVEDLTVRRSSRSRQRLAGEPLATPLPVEGRPFAWSTPGGERPVPPGPTALLLETCQTGLYRLTPVGRGAGETGARTPAALFAVNFDPRESDLVPCDATTLLALAGQPTAPGAVRNALAAPATPLAFAMLAAALVGMVVERVLVHRLARGRA